MQHHAWLRSFVHVRYLVVHVITGVIQLAVPRPQTLSWVCARLKWLERSATSQIFFLLFLLILAYICDCFITVLKSQRGIITAWKHVLGWTGSSTFMNLRVLNNASGTFRPALVSPFHSPQLAIVSHTLTCFKGQYSEKPHYNLELARIIRGVDGVFARPAFEFKSGIITIFETVECLCSRGRKFLPVFGARDTAWRNGEIARTW